MLQLVKMQFSLMIRKKGFQFAFTVMMLYAMGSFVFTVFNSWNQDVSSMYSAYTYCANNDSSLLFKYFRVLFPFLIVFPFTFSSMTDRVNQITTYIFSRCQQKSYFRSLYINAFIGGFVILFIPLFLNWLLLFMTIPQDGNFVFGWPYTTSFADLIADTGTIPFPWIFLKSTMAYAFVYDLIISAFAGLLSVFSMACSFYIKKYKIFALLPVYVILYICRIIDMSSFDSAKNGTHSYTALDPFVYVTITTLNGKRCVVIVLFCLVITLFSLFQLRRMERKEVI